MLARYEIRMLALPAETSRGRQWLLHQRSRVDKDLDFRLCGSGQHAGYLLQSTLDDVVIILALRVARYRSDRRRCQHGQRIVGRSVAEAEHDNGPNVRPQHLRVGTPVDGGLHPLHVAVAPLGHEGTQSLARRTYSIRCCYSHIDEAKLPIVRNQLVLELLAHFSCVLGGSEI